MRPLRAPKLLHCRSSCWAPAQPLSAAGSRQWGEAGWPLQPRGEKCAAMAHSGPWGQTGSRASPRAGSHCGYGYVDECWAPSVSFSLCCSFAVSLSASVPWPSQPGPLRQSPEPLPLLSGPPSHFPANRVSPLPSLWLNLLSAPSYSGSVPTCPSPPAPPPPSWGGGG